MKKHKGSALIYRAASCTCRLGGAVRHTQGHRSSSAAAQTHRHTAIQPHVALVCHFNGFQCGNLCKYTGNYSFTKPREMEGRVGLVGWRTANLQFTYKVVTCHRPKNNILTNELHCQLQLAGLHLRYTASCNADTITFSLENEYRERHLT